MFDYKMLSSLDILVMLNLQDIVMENLKDKDYFRPSTKDMLSRFVNNGFAIGAFKDDKLIAYRLLYIPKNSKDNLGLDLNFYSNELKKVIHFETALVHPDFRRNRLQVLLTNELLKKVDISDRIICASCHPMNYPSLSNLLKMGLFIYTLKCKYDYKLRFILSNKKFSPIKKENISYYCDETLKMKNLLNDGYVGYKLTSNNNIKKFNILFQKYKIGGYI